MSVIFRPTHRHNKTGRLYEVICEGLEVTTDVATAVVVYKDENGQVFVQMSSRFYDSERFAELKDEH